MTDGRPLGRFSVVDLTTVRFGPTCTKTLADFGAHVRRVERPGGEGRERVFDTLLAEGVIQEHRGGQA